MSVHHRPCRPLHLTLSPYGSILDPQVIIPLTLKTYFQPSKSHLAQAGFGSNCQWQNPHADPLPPVQHCPAENHRRRTGSGQ